MGQINVNIRMDSDIKAQADFLFNEFGLNFTTAVNAFVRQALREKAIPFQIRTVESAKPTREAILARGKEALREAQEQAIISGTSEMTLDEINALITESRQENRGA